MERLVQAPDGASAGQDLISSMIACAPVSWSVRRVRSPIFGDINGLSVHHGGRHLGVAWSNRAEDAVIRGLAEAFEREALRGPVRVSTRSTARLLGGDALSVDGAITVDRAQLTDEEIHLFRWTKDSTVSWTSGRRLREDPGPVLVPTDLVYLRHEGRDRHQLRPVNSTGTAFGVDEEQTVLSAVLEVVERHQLAQCVAGLLKATAIDISPVSAHCPEVAKLQHAITSAGLEIVLSVLPNHYGVSTVLACLLGDGGETPAVCFGSASRMTLSAAATSAMKEAIGSFHFALQLMLQEKGRATERPADQLERALWWASLESREHVSHYTGPHARALTGPIHPDSTYTEQRPGARLRTLCHALCQDGHELAAVDITPQNVHGRFHVARVVAPTLAPLNLDERYAYTDGLRRRAGAEPSVPIAWKPPHPFI